jgi:hypothetical protein
MWAHSCNGNSVDLDEGFFTNAFFGGDAGAANQAGIFPLEFTSA